MSVKIKNRKFLAVSNSFYDDYLKPNYWNKVAKNYKQILFKAGKPLQSRELNFMQSLFHDRIKTMCDIEYRNGSVVQGCDVLYDKDNGNIEVVQGIVYWDGIFFDIPTEIVHIENEDNKILYVYLIPQYDIINSNDDKELNDPAIRYKINQGVSGADRLEITFKIIVVSDVNEVNSQNIPIAIIDSNGKISLINRKYKYEDVSNETAKTEVKSGLKIRNNRVEKTSINYSVESGNGIIGDKEVVFDGNKIFLYEDIKKDLFDMTDEEDIYKEGEDSRKNTEVNFLDVKNNPLTGCIWGDIYLPINTNMDGITNITLCQREGMLNPGQKITICIELDNGEGNDSSFVEVATAEIAEVYGAFPAVSSKVTKNYKRLGVNVSMTNITNELKKEGFNLNKIKDFNDILTNEYVENK